MPFSTMDISRLTTSGKITHAAISPDGKYVGNVVKDADGNSLSAKHVNAPSNVRIAGPAVTEYISVAFAPDVNSVYYIALDHDKGESTLYRSGLLLSASERSDSPMQVWHIGMESGVATRITHDLNSGHQRISYNSCRNRHCPKCQSLAKARWLEARIADLLPLEYFHVVFTLPEQLASLALQNKRVVYNILFATAAETLRTIAADPKHLGAELGFLAVLHTWGQTLRHHPHLHCVVPGGGLSAAEDRWVSCRQGFFLPVNVLARLFRRLFLEALTRAFENGKLTFHGTSAYLAESLAFKRLLASLRAREWWVYAKPPFAGPEQVLAYLGRYTHRVAISNHRLLKLENGKVTFSWRDYARGNQQRPMTLPAEEFIRRFLLHVLPRGFQRLRQFGLLANRRRRHKLALCRTLLGNEARHTVSDHPLPRDYQSLYQTVTGQSLKQCPACRAGTMQLTQCLAPLSSAVIHYALHSHGMPVPATQAIDSS